MARANSFYATMRMRPGRVVRPAGRAGARSLNRQSLRIGPTLPAQYRRIWRARRAPRLHRIFTAWLRGCRIECSSSYRRASRKLARGRPPSQPWPVVRRGPQRLPASFWRERCWRPARRAAKAASRSLPTPASINITPACRSPTETKGATKREQDLKALMDRAAQSTGGAAVGFIAYKADYVAATEELKSLHAAARSKNCDQDPTWRSSTVIR